ncbi:hypothetical protein XELAEV_18028221mg [Xenopus laevis]|uniref:Uncharacterized protein n=1 Tax=Xenopus laevis TaxID=8355 RepID=A0A974CZG8_XENLA|nr:hypothetical protein XELAEV_18028221mg [Xenopus laevis]
MAKLNKRLLLGQALALVILVLIISPTDAGDTTPFLRKKKDRVGKRKSKQPQNKDCERCILVKIDINNPRAPESLLYSARNIENRSIVPWSYTLIKDNERIPSILHNVTCFHHCVGYERTLNAVPIHKQIPVLRKIKGNVYTLQTMVLTVGCTCVQPEIIMANP